MNIDTGFNNIRMFKKDIKKVAFLTNLGMYEPLIMYFGLTNSLATFQTMMNSLFKNLIYAGKVAIYMDNIIIFTKTMEEQIRIVWQVLQILKDNNLYL